MNNNKAPVNYQLEATNDFVFKALFTHEPVVGHQLCKSFLESFIGLPIYHLEVAPCDIYSQNVEAKDIRLDISLWINQKIATNIEMQINHSMKEIANRSLYYASLLFTNQANKGEPYDQLIKVNQIFVLSKRYFTDEDSYHRFLMKEERTGITLTEAMKIHIIELEKATRENKRIEEMSLYEKWCWFLVVGHDQSHPITKELVKDEIFRKAVERLEEMNKDERLRNLAYARKKREMDERQIRYEGMQEGIKEGIKEGLRQGERNEKLSIAMNLFKEGLEKPFISRITGLSLEELDELIPK